MRSAREVPDDRSHLTGPRATGQDRPGPARRDLSRDTLSRLLYGGRVSLGTAGLATTLVMAIGVTLGALSGFYGGWLLDDVLMRVVDVLLAFPILILALAITGTLGGGLANLILGLVVV